MLDSVGRLLGIAFHPPGAMLHVKHKTVTTREFSKHPRNIASTVARALREREERKKELLVLLLRAPCAC